MITKKNKIKIRQKKHTKVRSKIVGSSETPRLNVFRSNSNIYAQLIDDATGTTIASASTAEKDTNLSGTKIEQATQVGELIAERGMKSNISKVVFDRGGYVYQGRVKAVADGARSKGLNF